MYYFGCAHCRHFDPDTDRCAAYPDTPIPLPIIAGEVYHLKPMYWQKNRVIYDPKPGATYELVLANKKDFPDARFLKNDDFEEVGVMANGARLFVVGHEDTAKEYPLVVQVAGGEPGETEEVYVAPLYSLMSMMPGEVSFVDRVPGK